MRWGSMVLAMLLGAGCGSVAVDDAEDLVDVATVAEDGKADHLGYQLLFSRSRALRAGVGGRWRSRSMMHGATRSPASTWSTPSCSI